MTQPNFSLSKGERTRQTILEAAYSLFLEQGFHATSMRQIAERTGMAVGGIYNHFTSKEAIFDVLIMQKHPYQQILPVLQSSTGDTFEEFVRNGAHAMVAELGRRPDFIKLIFIEMIEFKGSHVPHLFQIIFPQIQSLLERFKTPDSRLRDIPLPAVMRIFIGLFFSYYIIETMVGNNQIPGFQGEVAVDQFIDIFLHGILKPTEST